MLENNRLIRFSGGRHGRIDAAIIRLMAGRLGAPMTIGIERRAGMGSSIGTAASGYVGDARD